MALSLHQFKCEEHFWDKSFGILFLNMQIFLYHFQSMFDYLDNAVIKLCDMSTVGTDLGTVKQQIEELKVGMRVSFLSLKLMGHSWTHFTTNIFQNKFL